MNRYLAELIGTFALVFAGCGAIVVDQLFGASLGVVGIGLVFGLIVMAMIYSIGNISGVSRFMKPVPYYQEEKNININFH